jgi:hypothetical protein
MFGEVYLREPIVDDIPRLLSIKKARGFSGMIGSIYACIGRERIVILLGRTL